MQIWNVYLWEICEVKFMNNIVFDEENPVTSDQLIWALFGKSTEDVARMFRDGKMVNMRIYLKRKTQSKRRKRLSKCQ